MKGVNRSIADFNWQNAEEEMLTLEFELEARSCKCSSYIAAENGSVSAIIVYTVVPMGHGDLWIGAYYGSVGDGENDGGYFRIDVENGSAEHLDYDYVDGLSEDDPTQAALFQAVMQKLWTLVDEDEGDLALTELGEKHYNPDDDGISIDGLFDGDSLDEVSEQWKIGLRFES